MATCECGNAAQPELGGMCEWCYAVSDEPAHVGHYAHFTGAWYCDTCNSPYCELA
jgi:NMD protein affecting ribosome stability and mRNA decay